MMKRYLLYVLLTVVVLPACGQGVTDYYRLPDQGHQYNRLVSRYGGPAIQNRWYVALDGFVKTDRAQLDNSFNGLIESDLVGKLSWGITMGWVYRERWAIEAAYARMPMHTQVSVSNAVPPSSLRATDTRNAFILRGKRLLISTSKPWLRSGFWLSGGVGFAPGKSQSETNVLMAGYRYQGTWETPTAYKLVSQTSTNPNLMALAELGAEYNVRLSNALDLGLSVRKFWGLSNAITTDVAYMGNRSGLQQAQLQGTGSGMSYGLTLRYTYSTLRKVTNALDMQGKIQRIR
jgi:hypothetical protein